MVLMDIFYENNINECYKKMESVKKELQVFNKISEDDEGYHPKFKNKYKRSLFRFENGCELFVMI